MPAHTLPPEIESTNTQGEQAHYNETYMLCQPRCSCVSGAWERGSPARCSRRDDGAPRTLAVHVRTRHLAIQPQSSGAAAVVEGNIGAKILDIRCPGYRG